METHLKRKADDDGSYEQRTNQTSKNTNEEGNSSQLVKNKKIKKKDKTTINQSLEGESSTVVSNSDSGMLSRWEQNAPYYIFYTTIPKSPATLEQKNAITFTDILCPSLGKLKETLQITFMVDVKWLMKQYKARNISSLPMTIIYDREFDKMEEVHTFPKKVDCHQIYMKHRFGVHHSKVGIYVYDDDSLRVVVSTANLHYEDWNHYNQGLWLSPRLPPMSETSDNDGESPTRFKSDLLHYLASYEIGSLKTWIERVEKTDFSQIRVFLVTSTPGKHSPNNSGSHMHTVARLLEEHCNFPEGEEPSSWDIIAQSSSVGSLKKRAEDWLITPLLRSLAAHKTASSTEYLNATLKFIYPTQKNVKDGYFESASGECLSYDINNYEKQKWFKVYLRQWKADLLQRSRAMPHIKSYTRVSPCHKKLAYYLLTSANLSQAAWGMTNKQDDSVSIKNYEVGVLFLPEFFGKEFFEIDPTSSSVFPFMYDLPLTPYEPDDKPWCTEGHM